MNRSSRPECHLDSREVLLIEWVQPTFPAPRCCVPGCGDKCKEPHWRVTYADGSVAHVEDCCVPWMVKAAPLWRRLTGKP